MPPAASLRELQPTLRPMDTRFILCVRVDGPPERTGRGARSMFYSALPPLRQVGSKSLPYQRRVFVVVKSRALQLAPAIAVLLIISLIAAAGFSEGLYRRVPANDGRFVFALSSAITAARYGVGGYVSFEPVEAALRANGLTSDKKILSEIDRRFPENFSDENLIARAIQHASSLEVPIPSPEFQNEQYNVRPAGGDDLGFIALATFAFWLFSNSLTAIYVCYLLIFAISVFLFWLVFRNEQAYLAVLLLTCAVFYALFLSPLFPGLHGKAWGSPLNGHFLSTLTFVPMLHILAVHCRCPKLALGQILCLAAQTAILYFAIRLRASAVWTVIPIFWRLASVASVLQSCADLNKLGEFVFKFALASAGRPYFSC